MYGTYEESDSMARIDELKAKYIQGDLEKEKMFEEYFKRLDTAIMIVELSRNMIFPSGELQSRPG